MSLETILTEQTLSFSYNSSYGAYITNIGIISTLPIEGETYQVVWDGQIFHCKAFTANDSVLTINLGNPAVIGGEDNGIPFVISSNIETGGTSIFTILQDSSHTIEIYYEKLSSEVVLYDRDMNLNSYTIDKGIRLYREDGSTRDFISSNPVETDVQLDFSNGDIMEVTPGENELFSKVNIAKPPKLSPENISKGVTIAGVKGDLEAGSIENKPIRFYDHLGNVRYGYTRAEIQEMTELPPGFNLNGASFDRWTHTLDQLKAVTYFADVGPTFKVGSYPATVIIIETNLANQTIPICTQYYNMSITINWGDGNTNVLSKTSSTKNTTTSHTYTTAGRYIIRIYSTDSSISYGSCMFGYSSSNIYYNIKGNYHNATTTAPNYSDFEIISILLNSYSLDEDPLPLVKVGINYAHSLNRLKFISGGVSDAGFVGYAYCASLRAIASPKAINTSKWSFKGCCNLRRLNTNTNVNSETFYSCDSLEAVIFRVTSAIVEPTLNKKWSMIMTSETPPKISVTSPTWGTKPIYVPDSALEAYKTADGWSSVAAYIFPASQYPDK